MNVEEKESTRLLQFLLLNPNSVKNKANIEKVSLNYLPFSTGFEIECNKGDNFNENSFQNIPNILDVSIDSGEQRFRIPNGINGFVCLYDISQTLIANSELNPLSGIHYHVDCTDYFDQIIQNRDIIDSLKEEILIELDTWEYQGNYNRRDITGGHSYIRLSSEHKTLEFRIGEMTFDYKLLCKRIIHCNQIVKRVVAAYKQSSISLIELDKEEITDVLSSRKKNFYNH